MGKKKLFADFTRVYTNKQKAARVGQPDTLQFIVHLPFAFAVHPALVVIASSVFFRCKTCGLLEDLDEVGLG